MNKLKNKLKNMTKLEKFVLGIWSTTAVFLITLIAVLVSLGNKANEKVAIKDGQPHYEAKATTVPENAMNTPLDAKLLLGTKGKDPFTLASTDIYDVNRVAGTIANKATKVVYTVTPIATDPTSAANAASNAIAAVGVIFGASMFFAIGGTVWASIAKKRGGKE